MSRSCEVSLLLSQRRKFKDGPGISIKTPDERKVDSILMGKRWELLQSKTIKVKIRGNSIFVDNVKLGSVVNFEFKPCQLIPDNS